jgi:hypothetical protein
MPILEFQYRQRSPDRLPARVERTRGPTIANCYSGSPPRPAWSGPLHGNALAPLRLSGYRRVHQPEPLQWFGCMGSHDGSALDIPAANVEFLGGLPLANCANLRSFRWAPLFESGDFAMDRWLSLRCRRCKFLLTT